MFFYFSFLRTPPQSGSQSSSVVFTPQVTNDLRTEPYPSSIDIFYWWISYTPQNVTRLSEPAKLTTWRQENAYKPLQIPPPSKKLIGAAAEIDCSLVLTPAPSVTSSVIDLRDPEIGRVPLPVCSLPIRISVSPQQQQRRDVANTTTTKSPKQEAITRSFRLFDDDGDAIPLMQIQETISFDLDKVPSLKRGCLRFFWVSRSADHNTHNALEIMGQRNWPECVACPPFFGQECVRGGVVDTIRATTRRRPRAQGEAVWQQRMSHH
jgi:hypothetical protein